MTQRTARGNSRFSRYELRLRGMLLCDRSRVSFELLRGQRFVQGERATEEEELDAGARPPSPGQILATASARDESDQPPELTSRQ